MKRLFTSGSLLLLLVLFSVGAQASHCAGGEIQYKWVSDSTYHVIFKLYRDCSGNTAPANVPLCYKSVCDNIPYSVTLLPVASLPGGIANGSSVSTGCAGYPNSCQNTSSTLPGYAEWWYEGDVTLPFKCSQWQFSVSISARNGSTNLNGGTGNLFYVEATLNNLIAQGNSSPVFTVKPVPFVCINNPYTYNNGAADADGDSLSYTMLSPQKGDCNSAVVAIPFSSTIYNTTNNPISTGNTFVLDPLTGQLSFTPTLLGASTLTLQVKEYRNNVLIGTTMRDIQVRTLTCNSVQPSISIDTLSVSGSTFTNGRIENCANKPMNFCFKVKSTNVSAILVASDNHLGVAPGASLSYVGQNTDSIIGCFSWTPSAADTGLKIFTVIVKDSTCLPPGIAVSQSFVLPIYIFPITDIYKDTTICAGTSVPLKASGGNVFTWTVLPGGAPLNSLSCTVCSNPIATPLVTTKYVVTSDLISVCNKNKDTVTITVSQLPPLPPAYSNSPICRGSSLNLFAGVTASSYQWTGPAGFNSTLQNPVIANAQVPNSGAYQVVARNGNCVSPVATINVTVDPAPSAPQVTGNSPVCEGQPILLTATVPGWSVLYYWSGPNGFSAITPNLSIPNSAMQNAGMYSVQAAYTGSACKGSSTSYTVAVNPKIVGNLQLSRTIICQDDTIGINYTVSGPTLDSLKWSFANGTVNSGTGTGPYVVNFPKYGEQAITVVASALNCVDSQTKYVNVLPVPSSYFQAPREACLDEVLSIAGAESVGYGLHFTWNFGDATIVDGANNGIYHIKYTTPGYKIVTLMTETSTCKSPTTADTIFVHPPPMAKILSASRNDVCTSDSIYLSAYQEPLNSYSWAPESFFEANNSANVEAHVYYTGYVYLNVADTLGCKSKDSILIHTVPCCEVYLPNAFTPNGDGKNDIFRIITVGHHTISNFRISNRWGQTVFETADERRGWDGSFNGIRQDPGSYFYYIKYKCSNGEYYEQKGDLLLIR